jgi:uncharacterized RDD family membrane protein YckC
VAQAPPEPAGPPGTDLVTPPRAPSPWPPEPDRPAARWPPPLAEDRRLGRSSRPLRDRDAAAPTALPSLAAAGLGQRAAAAAVDTLVVGVTWLVALFILVALLSASGGLDTEQLTVVDPVAFANTTAGSRLALLSGGVLFALSGFYHVYAWSRMRATPGQQLLRLQVVDARSGGSLGTGRALVRWCAREVAPFGLLLGALILIWYAALAVSIARSPARRGFHDIVAGSVVVAGAAVGAGRDGRSA